MSETAVWRSAGRPSLGAGLIGGLSVMLAGAVVVGRGVQPVAALLIAVSALVAWHGVIVRWEVLLGLVLAITLFVPIGRYTLPIDLPIDLEFFRIGVALVLTAWAISLVLDPELRVRRSPLDRPVALIVFATLGSVIVNFGRVLPLESAVLKDVTFFLSFVVFFYFVVSVLTSRAAVIGVAQFLVAGVAAVAFFAIVESRTHFNVFDHVRSVFPFLQFDPLPPDFRYGVLRAVGSSEHPIALGVLFAMVLPLAFGLAKSLSRVWWAPTLVIALGLLATVSRTPILVMVAAGCTLLWLRPRDVVRLLPLMIPMIIVIKIAVPGSLATVKASFFPEGGLIAQQTTLADDPTLISGRANLVPRLHEGMRTPLLGQGMGTRQTGLDNPLRNAPILDNQWLGLFLEIGLLGIIGWVWLVGRSVRVLGRIAQSRASPDGWLAAGLAAGITGFAVGMATYDSLAFVQEAFVFWTLVALSAALVNAVERDVPTAA
jgi:O-antigen ligase/polysaccharide polymerase Wzy-like membrane protein